MKQFVLLGAIVIVLNVTGCKEDVPLAPFEVRGLDVIGNSALADAVREFHMMEAEQDWDAVYALKSAVFRQNMPRQRFVKIMRSLWEEWYFSSVEILESIHVSGSKVELKVEFGEIALGADVAYRHGIIMWKWPWWGSEDRFRSRFISYATWIYEEGRWVPLSTGARTDI